jgi:hypothetical protein
LILIFHLIFLFLGVFNQLLFQTSPPNFFSLDLLLQFLSSTSPVFFDFSPPLQLLQFLLSNLLSSTMLSNPCFPNARGNGHWKIINFQALFVSPLVWGSISRRIGFVCVCVFFGYCFCANWKFLIFFVLHLFFSFHQLKNQKICKPGFINSTNHNPSPILNLGPF